jgi:hypothetical protein
LKGIGEAIGNVSIASKVPGEGYRMTLILAPDNGGTPILERGEAP